VKERSTPYWLSFLTHPVNQAVMLGTTAAGVLASVPWGWDVLGLTLLALAAVEVVGLAIVPGLPSFREAEDRKERAQARQARRNRLLGEIDAHGTSSYVRSYEQMNARVQSLYRMAADPGATLTFREVEQMDDLAVGYLAMCLSDAVMDPDEAGEAAAVAQRKLRALEQDIARQPPGRAEEQQLKRARAEYEEVLARHARMRSRRSALEASLVSMPVRMEEVYQMVVAAPASGELGALLEESLSKLRTAEEVTLDLDGLLAESPVRPAGQVAASESKPPPRKAQAAGTRER
jgi:hypothetical protein